MSVVVKVKEEGILQSSKNHIDFSVVNDYLPVEEKLILDSIDPTIITRLHSLLTGRDVFYLSKKYDYEVKFESSDAVSMILPESMVAALIDIKVDIYTLTKYWYASDEVKLADWTYSKAKYNLEKLIDFANSYEERQKIYLKLVTD